MTVILDLDYTLLDTKLFKEGLVSVFVSCGLAATRFDETYKMVVNANSPAYDYDLKRHIEMIADEIDCSSEELSRLVVDFLKQTKDYLYPGAFNFVKSLRNQGARLVLLTLGNEKWQRAKIEHAGLTDLFDEIITVGSDKTEIITRFAIDPPPVFVINDNCLEILAMQKIAPNFFYIVKRGPKGVRDNIDAPIFSNFEEILDFVEKQI